MNPAARAAIRARVNAPLDLQALTHEQAAYAVLDRALLWAELETSWRRSAWRGVAFILLPGALFSLLLWFLHPVWGYSHWVTFAPAIAAATILATCWFIDLITLAREAQNARTIRAVQSAIRPASDHAAAQAVAEQQQQGSTP